MAHHAWAMTRAWPPFHQPHTTRRQRSGRGPLSSLKPQQSPTSAYLNLDSSRHDPFQLRLYQSEKPIPLGRYDKRYKTGKWSTVLSPICIFLPCSLSCTMHLLIFPLVSVLYINVWWMGLRSKPHIWFLFQYTGRTFNYYSPFLLLSNFQAWSTHIWAKLQASKKVLPKCFSV